MPSFSFAIDLSRLLAPLAIILFSLLADIGTRLVLPAVRDYLEPLLGLPQLLKRWLQQKLARANRTSVELQKRGFLALLVMSVWGLILAIAAERVAHLHVYAVYGIWFCVWGWSVAWTLARDVLLLPTPTAGAFRIIAQRRLNRTPLIADQADAAKLYRMTILAMLETLVGGLAAPLCFALLTAWFRYPALYGAVFGVMIATLKAPRDLDQTHRLFWRLSDIVAQGVLYIPGRVLGIIMLLATLFTPKAKTGAALRVMLKQGHLYPDQSIGWLVAVVSGAFGIAFPLGRGTAWFGDARATGQIAKGALQQAIWLHVMTVILLLLILCATLLLSM